MITESTPTQEVPTQSEEVKNPAALLSKNKELLSKMKQLQEELTTVQNALDGEKSKHSDTISKLRQFRAEDPFKAVVKQLSPHAGLMEKILLEHLSLDVDAAGNAIVLNKAGEPLTWTRIEKDTTQTPVSVDLTVDSMLNWIRDGLGEVADSPAALLHKARGTGAVGNSTGHRPAQSQQEVEPAKAVPPAFGLR